MSAENKATIRRFIEEAWNRGNLSVVDRIFSSDHVGHDPANPPGFPPPGPDGVKGLVTMYRTAFPDAHFTIEDQIAEGDKVATRWRASGTHKGDLMGIAPTGRKVTVTGITIDHFDGVRNMESWSNWDALGLMQQLGVVPKLVLSQSPDPEPCEGEGASEGMG